MSMQRKKIVWNSGETRAAKRLRLMPHIANHEVSKEYHTEYHANLVPGALWHTSVLLTKDFSYPENAFDQPPFPYVVHASSRNFYNSPSVIPVNTFAIYIGEIRVDEITQSGREISVIRQCFVINGCRYLTRNINDFKPINNTGVNNVI